MIGMLQGTVALKDTPSLIIDVNGVGYKVLVANGLFVEHLLGEKVILFIHTHVREDLLELYGFASVEDLKLFELLISVSGVGCKTALGVFSIGNRSEIINAIITANVGYFTAVPRLGKKNAQKVIIELKNKLGGVTDLDLKSGESTQEQEAITALQSVGYTLREAEIAVASVEGENLTTEEIVRKALKKLGK